MVGYAYSHATPNTIQAQKLDAILLAQPIALFMANGGGITINALRACNECSVDATIAITGLGTLVIDPMTSTFLVDMLYHALDLVIDSDLISGVKHATAMGKLKNNVLGTYCIVLLKIFEGTTVTIGQDEQGKLYYAEGAGPIIFGTISQSLALSLCALPNRMPLASSDRAAINGVILICPGSKLTRSALLYSTRKTGNWSNRETKQKYAQILRMAPHRDSALYQQALQGQPMQPANSAMSYLQSASMAMAVLDKVD